MPTIKSLDAGKFIEALGRCQVNCKSKNPIKSFIKVQIFFQVWTLFNSSPTDLSMCKSDLISNRNFIQEQKASVEPESTKSVVEEKEGTGGAEKVSQSEERNRLMKDLDTRIVVQVGSQSKSSQPNNVL